MRSKHGQVLEAGRAYPDIRIAATGVASPWIVRRTLDLTPTEIDGQDLSRGSHLLCQVESRNPVAGGNIENGDSGAKIQMLQQRLSEGGGPIVVGRKRPSKS